MDEELNNDELLPGAAVDGAEAPEIEIEVQDDTPPQDKGRAPLATPPAEPTDEELANYSEGVRNRINQLTHARHDERRAREQLQREHEHLAGLARRALEENERLKQYVKQGETQFVTLSTSAAEAKVAAAREKLVKAQTDFDAEGTAVAMEELADAKAELARAKSFQPMQLQESPAGDTLPPSDPPKPQIHPKTAAWKARNTWFGHPDHVDASSFAMGLHKKLVDSGVDPRTDEYFEKLDAEMARRFPELQPAKSGQQREEPAKTSAAAASGAAPVSRSSNTPNGGKARVVLTQSELALCKTLGLTPQQYAAEKLKESTRV